MTWNWSWTTTASRRQEVLRLPTHLLPLRSHRIRPTRSINPTLCRLHRILAHPLCLHSTMLYSHRARIMSTLSPLQSVAGSPCHKYLRRSMLIQAILIIRPACLGLYHRHLIMTSRSHSRPATRIASLAAHLAVFPLSCSIPTRLLLLALPVHLVFHRRHPVAPPTSTPPQRAPTHLLRLLPTDLSHLVQLPVLARPSPALPLPCCSLSPSVAPSPTATRAISRQMASSTT